jgi:choline dehydrogenase-like flavoprotein
LSTPPWPAEVVSELTAANLPDGAAGYFRQASEQIGVVETNDFVFGDLHRAMRKQLHDGLAANAVADAVGLPTLPDHPGYRYASATPSIDGLKDMLGLDGGATISEQEARDQLKLEAPLAVQGNSGHAGFFPFNKFSTTPLLIKAAREAHAEARGDDARKRLMIVPLCHVTRLRTVDDDGERRVIAVETNQGDITVPPNGKVIVALGTIESARLARVSFPDLPPSATDQIGRNLMAHLRSNLDILIPRGNLAHLPATTQALQVSALFVKGRHSFANSNKTGTFHLQITASGLGSLGGNSEAELFKKIPDVDTYQVHRNANDTHVSITIRGIGEMQPSNDGSRVMLDPETDEFGVQRAFVAIANPLDPNQRQANPKAALDFELWNAMDQAAKDVAKIFGVANPPDPRRDGLGTTHHEAGTLAMGDTGSTTATLPDCRIRHVKNAYVMGPAVFPTIGSPNPMLTGVALGRRLGDQLARSPRFTPDPGFNVLFDGANASKWRMTTIRGQPGRDNPGAMRVINGALETVAGNDMGMFWCTEPTPPDFVLRLQWLRWSHDANSGVYVRFPDPQSKGYNNTAYVADDFGFEVQIDELGAPDGADIHRTGAIYRKDGRSDGETLTQLAARPPGEWNDYEIQVQGQLYTIFLNGQRVCIFDNENRYPERGLASTPTNPSYIGLQVYANPRYQVAFRHIQIKGI